MSIRGKTLALLVFLGMSFTLSAQTRTEYYPNGNKKFEGDYMVAWKDDEITDMEATDEEMVYRKRNSRSLMAYANLLPVKIYHGPCIFYYGDGKKFAEGTYKMGVQHGKFTYYAPDGKKTEVSFVNGMPSGKWTTNLPNGSPLVIAHYKPFTEAQLDTLLMFVDGNNYFPGEDGEENVFNLSERVRVRAGNGDEVKAARRYEREIERALQMLNRKAVWDGEFLIHNSQTGVKELEAHFKDNKKTGTWKVWDDGKLALEAKFEDDKLVKAKDHMPAPAPAKIPKGQVVEQPTSPEIFRYVEQMPEAPFDVHKYLNDNLRYPKGPGADDGARVVVQFVVTEEGAITDPKIVDDSPSVFHKEAIRLVQTMPKWKPAKQNGRPVKVYFTLPIIFKK